MKLPNRRAGVFCGLSCCRIPARLHCAACNWYLSPSPAEADAIVRSTNEASSPAKEDEEPRLRSQNYSQYLSKGSVLPTLKVGRADVDAGIFMKAILQGMVWVDDLDVMVDG